MSTPVFELKELANGQVDQYVVANESLRALENSVGGSIVIDFAADANYTLTDSAPAFDYQDEWRYKHIEFTDIAVPLTAGRDVIFPAKGGHEYIITNSTGFTLTLKVSGQTGVTIADGVTGRYYFDGADIVAGP